MTFIEAMYFPSDSKGTAQDVKTLIELLRNAEHYVVHRRLFTWPPCSEADVHERLEELLACVFPDCRHKPALPKPIKSFVPDTGLPSLATFIDYKYIDSRGAVKRICDEILADIGGYQSPGVKHLVFVIYETNRFKRERDWQQLVDEAEPKTPVTAIVLKGVRPTADEAASAERRRAEQRTPNPRVSKRDGGAHGRSKGA